MLSSAHFAARSILASEDSSDDDPSLGSHMYLHTVADDPRTMTSSAETRISSPSLRGMVPDIPTAAISRTS